MIPYNQNEAYSASASLAHLVLAPDVGRLGQDATNATQQSATPYTHSCRHRAHYTKTSSTKPEVYITYYYAVPEEDRVTATGNKQAQQI